MAPTHAHCGNIIINMSNQRSSNDIYGSQTELNTMDHSVSSMKYDITNTANKGTEAYENHHQQEQEHQHQHQHQELPEKLLFFNYHEYMVNTYTQLGFGVNDIHDQALLITHFPNYSAPEGSDLDKQTRIVRIPRVFNAKGIVYPEFSTNLPGTEDAAIQEQTESLDSAHFVPKGIYEGQLFGTTSVSPLSAYLDEAEFAELMAKINTKVRNCYLSYHFWNILEFLFDMLTFWLLSDVLKFESKRVSLDTILKYMVYLLTEYISFLMTLKNSLQRSTRNYSPNKSK